MRECLILRIRFPACCAVLAALIFLRDGLTVPIGRPLLLVAVSASLLLFDAEQTWLFSIFLLPLYPGLPGNYITLLMIGKLIFLACRMPARYCISEKTAVFVLLLSVYIGIQNLVLGEVSVYSFALCAELWLLFLLTSDRQRPPLEAAVSVFSLSVLISGAASLLVFAGEHSFAEIFSGAVRFGDVYRTEGMHMTLDPNFLGFSSLAGIAANAELLRRRALVPEGTGARRGRPVYRIALMLALFFFGAVGLSRTFLLCAGGLAMLELIACTKNPRLFSKCFALLLAFCAGTVIAASVLAPELIAALCRRFSADDLVHANGRVALITRWYREFTSSFPALLFGVGLFRTNVHATALQYLFGLGLVGLIPAAAAFAGLLHAVGFRTLGKGSIPAAVMTVMSFAVPAACSLSALFPLIFSFYVSAACSEQTEPANMSALRILS